MWAKWTAFYNWAKSADAAFSLARWAYWGILAIIGSGAAMIAWASTTWHWYWDTYSWAGVAFAFLVSWIGLALAFFLSGLGVRLWRGGPLDLWPRATPEGSISKIESPLDAESVAQDHSSTSTTYHPTVTASMPTLQAALYVCDIRVTFDGLKNDRHSELTMRVFNGTGRIVEFSGLISGHIKFSAPNNTDPSRMGDLPTPAMRPDTERTVAQLKEWLLILTQRVPAVEADKLIAMLEADIPIHFDLTELTIDVFAQDDPNNVERLPIWSGVSYNRGHGFGMINRGIMKAIEC
jgi:hypothetical protein